MRRAVHGVDPRVPVVRLTTLEQIVDDSVARMKMVTSLVVLFGAVSLLELSVQGLGFAIPSQILSASPYVITIVVLALISSDVRRIRLNSPASLGQPYRAE